MNNIWSNSIQGVMNLDLSREVRFRDDRQELYIKLLGLEQGMTIADIGCGPGTLTRKLAKWLGKESKIIGIDRDTDFIKYAIEKSQSLEIYNVGYCEGDALHIPLEDNSVDACISHTVIEHVPNKEFLIEQKRVCSSNGRVSVMYARPDKYIKTSPLGEIKVTSREEELLDKLFLGMSEVNEKYDVGKYWPDDVTLPKLFEEVGFKNIYVDAIAIPISVDDSRNSIDEKKAIIQDERLQLLESIEMGIKLRNDALTSKEIDELRGLANERFNRRIKLIQDDIKLWDCSILITQIVSGTVK